MAPAVIEMVSVCRVACGFAPVAIVEVVFVFKFVVEFAVTSVSGVVLRETVCECSAVGCVELASVELESVELEFVGCSELLLGRSELLVAVSLV